jgi:DNA-directed RNA polymerase subunit L
MEDNMESNLLTADLTPDRLSPEAAIVRAINELTAELRSLREEVSEMRKKMPSPMEG